MKVVAVRPMQPPVVEEVNNKLKDLQKFVGGYIEVVPMSADLSAFSGSKYSTDEDTVVLICNEEGKLQGLPLNRKIDYDIIAGDFLLCANKVGDHGLEFTSLSEKQIEWALKRFEVPEVLSYHNDLKNF